ncbi:MAG: nitroreductase family deazaflavin-dependent oxidoreductase [Acidimicrobiales bacterium]|jgi:deazaflavin-dependent oxidoreductase (nitroreductase family)
MSESEVAAMSEYEPSPWGWVADQVEAYEASGGTEANTLRETGIPIIVVTMLGHKSGKVRKVPLMRVEHEGEYAIIASKGGAPSHPGWYYNLLADQDVAIQDGPAPKNYRVREVTGDERAEWYTRGEAVFPPYTEYEVKAADADRTIPVFVATRILG